MTTDGFAVPYVTDSMHPGSPVGVVAAVLVILAIAAWAVRVRRSRNE